MEYYVTRRKESTNAGSLPEGGEGQNRSGRCHGHHFQHADGHFQYPRHPKFCNHAGSSSYPLGSEDFDGTHSGIQQCPDGG